MKQHQVSTSKLDVINLAYFPRHPSCLQDADKTTQLCYSVKTNRTQMLGFNSNKNLQIHPSVTRLLCSRMRCSWFEMQLASRTRLKIHPLSATLIRAVTEVWTRRPTRANFEASLNWEKTSNDMELAQTMRRLPWQSTVSSSIVTSGTLNW